MHHTPNNGSFVRGGKTSTDEEELDKLLQGLDKLTETLPDLEQQQTTSEAVSTRHHITVGYFHRNLVT